MTRRVATMRRSRLVQNDAYDATNRPNGDHQSQ
jgi:hypothetical protein